MALAVQVVQSKVYENIGCIITWNDETVFHVRSEGSTICPDFIK